MKKRTLGRTGLEVSELSFGGVFVMSKIAPIDDAQAAVHRAIELGVNYFDTAPTYGDSEVVLGQCLRDVTAPLIVSTKLGGRPKPYDPRDKAMIRDSFEQSLENLGRDQVDILMVHEPDQKNIYDWWEDEDNYTGPVTEVLDELKSEGLIKFTGIGGISAYKLAHVARSNAFDVVLTAFNYSLLWREAAHEILPAAVENNMGVVIGSPLQQGALACRHDDKVNDPRALSKPRREQFRALYDLCDDLKLSLPELGLRFVLSNDAVSTTLMGPKNQQEVEENVAAVEKGPLPTDIMNRLDEIYAMVPFHPCHEPQGSPFWL